MDEVNIFVKAGKGGDGLVSFWREKFQPFGGPDGGDGGRGGDVYLVGDTGERDLYRFKNVKRFQAEKGNNGGSQKKTGKDGSDLLIKVPVGTKVYRVEEDKKMFLADLSKDNQRLLVVKGGRGGLGNVHFASATQQAPKKATQGSPGRELTLFLEYSIPCDVCIIGLPNAGKSSLLNRITSAQAKIADYPFTTVEPVLGRADFQGEEFTIAEMPALIRDADKGKGLGNRFLRHCSRARVLVLLLDASVDGASAEIKEELEILEQELRKYNPSLLDKGLLLAVNKIDLDPVKERLPELKEKFASSGMKVAFISVHTGEGIDGLIQDIVSMLKESKKEAVELPEAVFMPEPMKRRKAP